MLCPYCAHQESKVVDKRDSADDRSIRRRRECLRCAKRFTTYERVEMLDLRVIKKDGKREIFDKNKLMRGIAKACEKTSLGADTIEKIAGEVDADLRKLDATEISSKRIGELVMRKLKKADKVAYIRFASVYREFADLDSFQKELKKLIR